MSESYQSIVNGPGFAIGVHCDDDEIIRLDYLSPQADQSPTSLLAGEAVRQLRAYFADHKKRLKRGEAADFAKGHLGSNLERIVRGTSVPVLVAAFDCRLLQEVGGDGDRDRQLWR